MNGTAGETGVNTQTLSSNSTSFVIGGSALVGPTSNRYFLIATPAFAALPGAPTPDREIPAGSIPFASAGGDTISYGAFDSVVYGSGVLPTDGILSLNDNLTTGVNSPTNYAGTTGSVNAAPPASVPALPSWQMLLATALLLAGSGGALLRARG